MAMTSLATTTQSHENARRDADDVIEQTVLTLLNHLRYDPDRLKKFVRMVSSMTRQEDEDSQLQSWEQLSTPRAAFSGPPDLTYATSFKTMHYTQDVNPSPQKPETLNDHLTDAYNQPGIIGLTEPAAALFLRPTSTLWADRTEPNEETYSWNNDLLSYDN